jgi:hypothetical protein
MRLLDRDAYRLSCASLLLLLLLGNASEGASLSPSLDLGAAWHSQSLSPSNCGLHCPVLVHRIETAPREGGRDVLAWVGVLHHLGEQPGKIRPVYPFPFCVALLVV